MRFTPVWILLSSLMAASPGASPVADGTFIGRTRTGIGLMVRLHATDDACRRLTGAYRFDTGTEWTRIDGAVGTDGSVVLSQSCEEGPPRPWFAGRLRSTILQGTFSEGPTLPAAAPHRIARLIADLDARDAETREAATRQVARLEARASLKRDLERSPSAELENRIRFLLDDSVTLVQVAFETRARHERERVLRAEAFHPMLTDGASPMGRAVKELRTEALARLEKKFEDFCDEEDGDDLSHGHRQYVETWNLEYRSDTLASLKAEVYFFSCEERDQTSFLTRTLWCREGSVRRVELKDLFKAGAPYLQALTRHLARELDKRKSEWMGSVEFEDLTEHDFEAWIVTPAGLRFFLEARQVQSESFEMAVPWAVLKGLVDPEGPLQALVPGD